MRMGASDAVSYAGAVASLGASITLEKLGVLVGIATAAGTFILNWYYKRKSMRLDAQVAAARIKEAQSHTGAGDGGHNE